MYQPEPTSFGGGFGPELPVDILIGSDYYWNLVTGSISRSGKGPTVIHTKVGWVLSVPAPTTDLVRCSMILITTHIMSFVLMPFKMRMPD